MQPDRKTFSQTETGMVFSTGKILQPATDLYVQDTFYDSLHTGP